jgi:uncharacterized protein (DUF1778 family)
MAKLGRPRREGGLGRNLTLRVTNKERDDWERAARDAELQLSDFIRLAVEEKLGR